MDGSTVQITHVGHVQTTNNQSKKDVLCVPSFQFNLLSVSKLRQENNSFVTFYPNFCLVQDCVSKAQKGFGKQKGGLYYEVNVDLKQVDNRFLDKPLYVSDSSAATSIVDSKKDGVNTSNKCLSVSGDCIVNKHTLWHLRLGHGPRSKLSCIDGGSNSSIFFTCPKKKMYKQREIQELEEFCAYGYLGTL